MQPKFFNRVSVKLIIIISSVILLNLAVYTYYTINQLRRDLTESSKETTYNISDIIKKSTRYGMLLNRKEDVYHIINTIGTEQGVDRIRIYNKLGQISFSTDSTEVNNHVNMKDEACIVCHSKETIPSTLPQKEMIRFYTNAEGKKVLGLINPIKNEKDCYTGDCHYHDSKKQLLGVLDVIVSAENIESIVDSNIKTLITNALVLTGLISFLTIISIGSIVNKPLKKVQKGIEELSKGNLNYKIDVDTKDELGEISHQFNNMSQKLDLAYKEIKDWTDTLNLRVQEKNEELKKIYEQITQIEKLASLGTLSATVAHELNNPLEGILTYSKLIVKKLNKTEKTDEIQKMIDYLTLISDESARCGKIVKDLLLFSKQGTSELRENNLCSIIVRSLTIINHHLELNKINLIENYSVSSLAIVCDHQKIEQALIAILMNAIESMPEGGDLKVLVEKENDLAVIRIKDQGKGIADKDLSHIFEPFYSTKGGNKGTGLGLAVAYGIIIQHKGRIIVEETSLKGTTFKISLPINKILD